MADREPSSLRLVATLAVTGLVSGIVLAGVYIGTLPTIRKNQAEALRAAIFQVLPATETIDTLVVRDGKLVPYDGPAGTIPDEQAVYAGRAADGTRIGFAIPADGPGFMDTIGLIYGYDPARRAIIGMQVLDSRETPGLGDRITSDPQFLANFRELAIDPDIVPVKRGEKTAPNEVDTITGATISSEAVVGILERSTHEWAPRLEDAP